MSRLFAGRDPCVKRDNRIVPSNSKSYGRHRGPLYPEILFPDRPSYHYPLSPDLHSGIIDNELKLPSHERPGPFACRYLPGLRRYPGILRKPVPTLAGLCSWIGKYIG
jgi:hypothetical protein